MVFRPQHPSRCLALAFWVLATPGPSQPARLNAAAIVKTAVAAELEADQADKSTWKYLDHDKTPEKDAVYVAIETPEGELRRKIELGGKSLSPAARSVESDRIAEFVHSKSEQEKQRKDSEHDDTQAHEMLRSLPDMFTWTVVQETPEYIELDFQPNPDFHPPDMQSRVFAVAEGQMIVARDGNRIHTLRGKLTQEVKIGFGILGKLDAGGTFDIERREIEPGRWQITETHVHIGGRALMFKTIGQQEDEVKTNWQPSSALTLQEAEEQLRDVH